VPYPRGTALSAAALQTVPGSLKHQSGRHGADAVQMSPRENVFGGRCDELSALHSRIAVCNLCKNRSQAVSAFLAITAAVFYS